MGLKKSHPPRWADRFLEWYCRPDRLEEIQGDAYELYYRKCKQSQPKADLQFVWNVLRFFRLKNIRKTRSVNNNTIITVGMLKNIFKVAIRNFLHQPGHSFLSVLGLTVSFASAFLILLWITHEFSFDRFHDQPQRIFKVMSHVETNGTLETYDAAAAGMDVSSIPEVEQHVTVVNGVRWPNELCFKPAEKANECIYLNGIYAQPSLFSAFNFAILQGETNPFKKVESIAISENMSQRLFDTKDVIGKTLSIDGWLEVTITSVFRNVPSTSSIQFDFVMPIPIFQKLRGLGDDQLATNFFSTFIKTNTDIRSEDLTRKLNDPLVLTDRLKNDKVSYSAFPITDWRLKSTFENGQSVGGRIEYVILFIIIATLVVTMAVINFINLSTAKASTRSKEIGIRKVTGAVRTSIIFQFVSESFVVVFFAFIMAAVLTQLTLPFFSNLIGEQISVQLLSGWIPVYMFGFLFVVALAAGLYPAFVMSSFQPAKVLKGELTNRHSGAQYLRKVLLVVQLSVSIGIIIFSGVLFSQLNFITNKNLGYDRGNMVRIEPTYKLLKQYESFKNELLTDPNIKSVTATNANPLSLSGHTTGVSWSGKADDMRVTFQTLGCSYEFLETFGLTILEGRSFQPKPVDTIGTEILVSEEAVKIMGLSNPIGERVKIGDTPCVIIGMVNNFHTEDLRNKQLPVIIYPQPILNCSAIYVKYEAGTTQQAMETVQSVYKKMEPAFTMKYWFQDETFDTLYKTEITASYTVMLFTIVSLIIAVIGVVGLSTYNAIRRKKEIGIKRVFGATTGNILTMLTKEFVLVIFFATVLSMPFAWFGASHWLSGFAYAIDMPWWIFVMTFAGISSLTILIICIQGLKTVVTNPTQILRSE